MADQIGEGSTAVAARGMALVVAVLRPVLVVAAALIVGMVIIVATHQNPFPAYENLLIEPFRSWDSFSSVLFYAIPLVFTGLAATVAFRAGVFNIGGEGQLQMGALATTWVAVSWTTLPAIVLAPISIVAAIVAGALFAAIAGWIRAYLGATELVSTIMLNYIAADIATYYVTPGGPLATTSAVGGSTNPVPNAITFPTIGGSQFHWGFVVALIAVVAIFTLIYRTPLGYELRMVGHNPAFARFGGVATARVIMSAFLISGGLAGLAGAVQVLGFLHEYSLNFLTAGWGFTGVTVALLARLEPIGVLVAAFLYALLEEGAQLMENNTSVDHNVITVVQGLIILLVTVQIGFSFWRKRRGAQLATA